MINFLALIGFMLILGLAILTTVIAAQISLIAKIWGGTGRAATFFWIVAIVLWVAVNYSRIYTLGMVLP